MGDFSNRVLTTVCRIPRGKVATYGQIARLIGEPRKSRFVGYALRANPAPGMQPDDIPCHRVVFKDGHLPEGYLFGGPDVQHDMLAEEGVKFLEDGFVDMDACLWDGFSTFTGDEDMPTAPPPDFDWEAELGDA